MIVGRFGRPHGIKGMVVVQSFTDPIDNILHYKPWHRFINGKWTPLVLESINLSGKQFVVQIQGYTDRDQAAELTHATIGIPREMLPCLPQQEYYWHDLIGMRVFNREGVDFGTVKSILPTASNDVLVVENEQKTRLLPFILGQYVDEVDIKTQAIKVDWDATL